VRGSAAFIIATAGAKPLSELESADSMLLRWSGATYKINVQWASESHRQEATDWLFCPESCILTHRAWTMGGSLV
jgi:hypothetical protein